MQYINNKTLRHDVYTNVVQHLKITLRKISNLFGLIVSILTIVSCAKETEFEKIDYDWSIDIFETIGKNLNPEKKYNYWALIRSNDGGHEKVNVVHEQGELAKRNQIDLSYNPNGFIVGGHHSHTAYYIIAIENDNVFEIRNTIDLLSFLGEIDTMEEALLITQINEFGIDYCDERGSSYRKVKDGYEFYLMEKTDWFFLESLENIQSLVSVNSSGKITSKSLGVYCQGKLECLCL